jgi:FtsH-binding integral membrane protein
VKLQRIGDDRKIQLAGISAVTIVSILSYITHSPLKFILAVAGIVSCVYAAKKLKDQFNAPLVFIRRNGVNYWGGAFGGLIGGVSGLYGATRDLDKISFAEFGVDLSLITIYLVLGCILFMGTVLQDVKDGYIELKS